MKKGTRTLQGSVSRTVRGHHKTKQIFSHLVLIHYYCYFVNTTNYMKTTRSNNKYLYETGGITTTSIITITIINSFINL